VKVIALISWYAESPTWLATTVASCARFCDHVVAVDGAFRHFPEGTASSGAEQQEAIIKTAEAAGMGVTLHVPSEVWMGNEIEKTNARFRLAEAIAEPDVDWMFVIDADSVVVEAPPTVREDLEATPLDVATISLADWIDWHKTPELETLAQAAHMSDRTLSPLRCFFRAIPGIWCEGTHAHWFVKEKGEYAEGQTPIRCLRGSDDQQTEQALDLGSVIVEHRHRMRTAERAARKKEYYRRRDAFDLEPGFRVGPPKMQVPA